MSELNKNLTILVIEDNEMFRRLALDMLKDYTTYAADSASDGIRKFKQYNPDIVFIDIELPDGSGQSILVQIKSLNPNAFMVMLTASNLQKDVQDSVKNGAQGYIIKPFSRQKIKDCIDKYYAITDSSNEIKDMK